MARLDCSECGGLGCGRIHRRGFEFARGNDRSRVLIVAVGSVLTGLLQSLVLRRRLDVAGRWVLATIGAVAAIGVLVFAVRVFDAGVGAAATGTALGVTQWMALIVRLT